MLKHSFLVLTPFFVSSCPQLLLLPDYLNCFSGPGPKRVADPTPLGQQICWSPRRPLWQWWSILSPGAIAKGPWVMKKGWHHSTQLRNGPALYRSHSKRIGNQSRAMISGPVGFYKVRGPENRTCSFKALSRHEEKVFIQRLEHYVHVGVHFVR